MPKVNIFKAKELREARVIEKVAQARGCEWQPPADASHDGRFVDGLRLEVRVEVVDAFPGPPAERHMPAQWATQKAREAREDYTRNEPRPPVTEPHDRGLPGILKAISDKTDKYGKGGGGTILVVRQVEWMLGLEETDLKLITEHASNIGAPFPEIWIVNEYGGPAQKVPLEAVR